MRLGARGPGRTVRPDDRGREAPPGACAPNARTRPRVVALVGPKRPR